MPVYVLGVDGGASKTAALVSDENGLALGRGLAGGSNHLRVGIEEATRNVERSVNAALVQAGIAIREIAWAYCGIAGADHPVHRQRVIDSLRVFFPDGNFTVDNDARIALTGATGFGAGIVIIAGTGSVAFGRNSAGLEARAGGWGPTLGDEGSGYSIARAGLSAIVRARDGRGPQTAMTELLCQDFGMCNPDELPRFVYATTTHADDIARHLRIVIEGAEAGDAMALSILREAGRELGLSVLAVARAVRMTKETFPVASVGGAFHAGATLIDAMSRTITADCPLAVMTEPSHSPVEGAVMMALQSVRDHRPDRGA